MNILDFPLTHAKAGHGQSGEAPALQALVELQQDELGKLLASINTLARRLEYNPAADERAAIQQSIGLLAERGQAIARILRQKWRGPHNARIDSAVLEDAPAGDPGL